MTVDHTIETNGIRLHYLDFPGGEPSLLLMHGLTVNAHCFDGLVAAGLSPRFRVVAPDFRGRGASEKPESGYSMEDHVRDMLGLTDALGLRRFVAVGHSFGGLVALYMAARYPERVSRIVILDASTLLITPETKQALKAALGRLDMRWPSMEAYLETMRQMPFLEGRWSPAIERFYAADVRTNEDGTVQPLASAAAIEQTIDAQFTVDWQEIVAAVRQPVILLHSVEPYGPPGAPPLMPTEMAQRTVASLADCAYAQVPGNHVTMIVDDGASRVVADIVAFVTEEGPPFS